MCARVAYKFEHASKHAQLRLSNRHLTLARALQLELTTLIRAQLGVVQRHTLSDRVIGEYALGE